MVNGIADAIAGKIDEAKSSGRVDLHLQLGTGGAGQGADPGGPRPDRQRDEPSGMVVQDDADRQAIQAQGGRLLGELSRQPRRVAGRAWTSARKAAAATPATAGRSVGAECPWSGLAGAAGRRASVRLLEFRRDGGGEPRPLTATGVDLIAGSNIRIEDEQPMASSVSSPRFLGGYVAARCRAPSTAAAARAEHQSGAVLSSPLCPDAESVTRWGADEQQRLRDAALAILAASKCSSSSNTWTLAGFVTMQGMSQGAALIGKPVSYDLRKWPSSSKGSGRLRRRRQHRGP